jgi:HSP20 family protein
MADTATTATKVPVEREKAKGTALQGWSGWNPFESLQREVDRIFEDFGRGWGMPAPRRWFAAAREGWTVPAVDIAEKDSAYEVTAELPGIDEKNIELSVANDILSIRGAKSEEREDKRKDYRLSERRYGSFERSFSLPEDADPDKIEATFKNGVLKVTLPKRPGAKPAAKKIAIKST